METNKSVLTKLLKPIGERMICCECEFPNQVKILKLALKLACADLSAGNKPVCDGKHSLARIYVDKVMEQLKGVNNG